MSNLLRRISSSEKLNNFKLWIFKNFGIYFKIKRFLPSTMEQLRTVLLCNHYNIKYVFDIGANTGQFANYLFKLGYKGKIISFEPTSEVHSILKKRAKNIENWIIAELMALGSTKGNIYLYKYADSVFNSALQINSDFAKDKDYLKVISKVNVPVNKLDDIASKYFDISASNYLLKIDTQGFEKEVLDGAKIIVNNASLIKIEVPIKPIYNNTKWTFYEIISFMKEKNFHPINFDIEGANENGIVRTVDFTFLNLSKHKL